MPMVRHSMGSSQGQQLSPMDTKSIMIDSIDSPAFLLSAFDPRLSRTTLGKSGSRNLDPLEAIAMTHSVY